jgi:hypothetical protein
MPIEQSRSINVPAAGGECQVSDFRVRSARPIIGFASDEQGRLVAGARIQARFTKREDRLATPGQDFAESGDKGRFQLEQIPPDTEVELVAQTGDRGTRRTVTVDSGQDTEVLLTLEPGGVVHLEGRMVDPSGRPIPEATVTIHGSGCLLNVSSDNAAGGQAGDARVRTSQAGVFRTPFTVLRDATYSLRISADGMLPQRVTHRPNAEEVNVSRLGDVTLTPAASAAGVVVDPAGNPLSGVTVWSDGIPASQAIGGTTRARDTTDDEGRFQIPGLHPNARFVFAEQAGFRMTGCVLGESPAPLRIVMSPIGSPSAAPPPEFLKRPPEEKRRLLKQLIEPLLPRLEGHRGSAGIAEAAKRLAPYEPEIVLGQWDRLDDFGRVDVLLAMNEIDEAFQAASAIDGAYLKTYTLVQVAAVADAAQQREILAEALVWARAVTSPAHRVVLLATIAERLYDVGEKELAQTIVREGQPTATELAPTEWTGFARGYFAEVLALFDPAAALKLVGDLKDPSARTRHFGNIAHELAKLNPAAAERSLGQITEDQSEPPCRVPVCYRMARADLQRARRIADAPMPEHHQATRAHAYGVMAMALAEADPGRARSLLRAAFDLIGQGTTRDAWQEHRFVIGFILLRFAATIDPESSNECFWKALSLHPGPAAEDWSSTYSAQLASETVSKLVVLLSLYGRFPDLCRRLMEPVRDHVEKESGAPTAYRQDATLTALALTEPDRIIAWYLAGLRQLEKDSARNGSWSWKPIADAVGNDGEELGHVLTEGVFRRWTIDREDF